MGVYRHLIPAGVGRAGDCIYINIPLKQLRPRTKQQRLAGHHLMAAAAPRRLGTGGNPIPRTRTQTHTQTHTLSWTPLKDPLLNNLKRQRTDTPAIRNLQSENLSPLGVSFGLEFGWWKKKKEKEITDTYIWKSKNPRKRAEIEVFNLEFRLSIIFKKEEKS